MNDKLYPVDPSLLEENPFKLIGLDWMLITAGVLDNFNTMTASYGTLGELWHRPVAYCYIRPTRHTYQFMEKHNHYSLSFFDEKYRDILKRCGSKSGRDIDKMKGIGLTPVSDDSGAVYFSEARLVMICRKIYYQDIDPANFLDSKIDSEYNNDYHRSYIGQIIRCLMKK